MSLAVQVAGALEEAHEQGVIHRDLKPSNIMVTPKGHVKVLDFGLAKLLDPVGTPEVTLSFAETRGPVGTVYYMSPEQAEGSVVDSRTDLWSLGVVLYEAIVGNLPFQGASRSSNSSCHHHRYSKVRAATSAGRPNRSRSHRRPRARKGFVQALPERFRKCLMIFPPNY